MVLNQDYQAISVCSVERAFVLLLLDKAEMVCDNPTRKLRSVRQVFDCPSIIRLFRYIKIPYRNVALSRHNIYKRDGFCCAYCGNRDGLTLDHVLPKSRGGRDSWHNLVTACGRCNSLKGDRTPEEAEMVLKMKPFRPSFIVYLRDFAGSLDDEWKPYLMFN